MSTMWMRYQAPALHCVALCDFFSFLAPGFAGDHSSTKKVNLRYKAITISYET